MSDWKQVIVRGKVKEYFFCKEVGNGKYVYQYRVSQLDGVGKDVDTWKKRDNNRQPFRTLRDAETHRKAYIKEIMGRTERNTPYKRFLTTTWRSAE